MAPNAFKGSITAADAAASLARGFRRGGWEAVECPVADGGPGTGHLLAGRLPRDVAMVEMAETDHLFARIPLHVPARPGRRYERKTKRPGGRYKTRKPGETTRLTPMTKIIFWRMPVPT